MRTKTTTALALAGAALAAPAAAAQEADAPPSPLRAAVRAPLGGHLTVAAQMRAAGRAERQDHLILRAVRLAPDGPAERRRLQGTAPAGLRERIETLRERRREARAPAVAVPPVLEAIAACESGGDPATSTGNGFYGKYQFTLSTWASVGGSGNPAAASEAEQDERAALLYAREGAAPWPVCGR